MKRRVEPDFTIRAHHFSQLEVMLSRQMYANGDTTPSVMAAQRAQELTLRAERSLKTPDRQSQVYGRDLLGRKLEHKEAFFKAVEAGFLTFLSLPETAWICLNTEYDWICNACKIGEHCAGATQYDADLAAILYLQADCERFGITHYVLIQQIAKGSHQGTVFPQSITLQKAGLRKIVLESDQFLKIRYNRRQQSQNRKK